MKHLLLTALLLTFAQTAYANPFSDLKKAYKKHIMCSELNYLIEQVEITEKQVQNQTRLYDSNTTETDKRLNYLGTKQTQLETKITKLGFKCN